MKIKSWQWEALLFVLASPMLASLALLRGVRHLFRLRQAIQPSVLCKTCGAQIMLIGLWRCPCGFTYQGHVLRTCPVCHSLIKMIRCHQCGTTKAIHL